jgi:hypothetical protein
MFALVDFVQYRSQFSQRHRTTQQVTLNEVAAVAFEKLVLLERFDAFGNHL